MASSAPVRRSDGRGALELRPVQIEVGQLDRADGSGRFSFGPSGALASVSGPLEVRLREELPDKATFEVQHRPLEGIGATPSRAIVNTLQAVLPPLLALGHHPRSLVQLVVQSLSPSPSSHSPLSSTSDDLKPQMTWPPLPSGDDDGPLYEEEGGEVEEAAWTMTGSYFSSRAACINASTLAFLDAGSINMKGVILAVALAQRNEGSASPDSGGELILDPSNEEERDARARYGFGWALGAAFGSTDSVKAESSDGMAMDGENKQVGTELVWAESQGSFSRDEFEDALKQSRSATLRIYATLRGELEKHHNKVKLR